MTHENINEALPTGIEIAETQILSNESHNIHIVINPEVLLYLKKEVITISELFVLVALYNDKIHLLDIYDDKSTNNRILLYEYQRLLIHGFLQYPKEDSIQIYELTDKGKAFVEDVSQFFELEVEEKQSDSQIKKLAAEYRELFPNIRLPSKSYGRVSSVELEKKFKGFFSTYAKVFKKEYGFKLTPEDILEATRLYVARFEANGYLYMANSAYFIQKKDKSALADELIALKNGINDSASMDKFTKRL